MLIAIYFGEYPGSYYPIYLSICFIKTFKNLSIHPFVLGLSMVSPFGVPFVLVGVF